MRFSAANLLLLAVLTLEAFARPSPLLGVQKAHKPISGKYLVGFKKGASRKSWLKKQGVANAVDWPHANGIAASLTADALNSLRASPDVAVISEDDTAHGFDVTVQANEPWGLHRISTMQPITDYNVAGLVYNYTYNDSCGDGVDIYVFDTGIYLAHNDFEGRATWGLSVETYAQADGNGHGTHVAGSAAGKIYGVAKKANLIAVKVLDDVNKQGSYSGIITGLNWVIGQVQSTGRPSIVSMSLGGPSNDVLDAAVNAVVNAGIHVVVAAGNDATDAVYTSPARMSTVITVGATTIQDQMATYSNYGAVVNLFAPGDTILSAWIGSPDSNAIDFGTSMATPHVSGIVACLISTEGNIAPADMIAKVQNYTLKGALSGIPSGTANYLAHNQPH